MSLDTDVQEHLDGGYNYMDKEKKVEDKSAEYEKGKEVKE